MEETLGRSTTPGVILRVPGVMLEKCSQYSVSMDLAEQYKVTHTVIKYRNQLHACKFSVIHRTVVITRAGADCPES